MRRLGRLRLALAAISAVGLLMGGAVPAIAGSDNGAAQGNAQSDPNDDGRGPDRGTGGPDREDRNNGCGNDADRSDDNEGWCGNKHDDGDDEGGSGEEDPCVLYPWLCGGAS